jgi:hypothetical protein
MTPWDIAVWRGTKIAGDVPDMCSDLRYKGSLLFTLGSINPSRTPFPFANTPDEIDFDQNFLMFLDCYVLFVFLDGKRIHWSIEQ